MNGRHGPPTRAMPASAPGSDTSEHADAGSALLGHRTPDLLDDQATALTAMSEALTSMAEVRQLTMEAAVRAARRAAEVHRGLATADRNLAALEREAADLPGPTGVVWESLARARENDASRRMEQTERLTSVARAMESAASQHRAATASAATAGRSSADVSTRLARADRITSAEPHGFLRHRRGSGRSRLARSSRMAVLLIGENERSLDVAVETLDAAEVDWRTCVRWLEKAAEECAGADQVMAAADLQAAAQPSGSAGGAAVAARAAVNAWRESVARSHERLFSAVVAATTEATAGSWSGSVRTISTAVHRAGQLCRHVLALNEPESTKRAAVGTSQSGPGPANRALPSPLATIRDFLWTRLGWVVVVLLALGIGLGVFLNSNPVRSRISEVTKVEIEGPDHCDTDGVMALMQVETIPGQREPVVTSVRLTGVADKCGTGPYELRLLDGERQEIGTSHGPRLGFIELNRDDNSAHVVVAPPFPPAADIHFITLSLEGSTPDQV